MLEIDVSYNPEIPLLDIYPKYREKTIHMTIYSGIIHNGQKMKTTQSPPNNE